MRPIAVLALLVACSGSNKPKVAGKPPIAKKMTIAWGVVTHDPYQEDVFLQATDEIGNQTSYPLGTYPGHCMVFEPSADMKATTAISCAQGIEIDAVIQPDTKGDILIVLKGKTPQGQKPDPLAREEITRVQAEGANIVVSKTPATFK